MRFAKLFTPKPIHPVIQQYYSSAKSPSVFRRIADTFAITAPPLASGGFVVHSAKKCASGLPNCALPDGVKMAWEKVGDGLTNLMRRGMNNDLLPDWLQKMCSTEFLEHMGTEWSMPASMLAVSLVGSGAYGLHRLTKPKRDKRKAERAFHRLPNHYNVTKGAVFTVDTASQLFTVGKEPLTIHGKRKGNPFALSLLPGTTYPLVEGMPDVDNPLPDNSPESPEPDKDGLPAVKALFKRIPLGLPMPKLIQTKEVSVAVANNNTLSPGEAGIIEGLSTPIQFRDNQVYAVGRDEKGTVILTDPKLITYKKRECPVEIYSPDGDADETSGGGAKILPIGESERPALNHVG